MTDRPPTTLIRLRPRPTTLHVSRGRTVLATAEDGLIRRGSEHGLFVHETRLLSEWGYTIDGLEPEPVALSNVEQHSWLGYYILAPPGVSSTNPDHYPKDEPDPAQQSLEVRVARVVGEGLHEDLDLTNFTQEPTEFRLQITINADFADVTERGSPGRRGRIRRRWTASPEGGELRLRYRARHAFEHPGESGTAQLSRGVTLRIDADAAPEYFGKRIRFAIRLSAGGTWHACLRFFPEIDGVVLPAPELCHSFSGQEELDRRTRVFLDAGTRFSGREHSLLSTSVLRTIGRARSDLAALRLFDLDHGDDSWTVAAGLPLYVALFGRDSLTAGWQSAVLGPEMMRGALEELRRWQGTRRDDWRDEQPGRMLHEAHTGPLEMLNFNPRRRYYGSATTSGFYPLVLSELWHWSGDKQMVGHLLQSALDGIRWLDRNISPDGFHRFQTRSPQGIRNQGWKDSGDAMVDEDGRQVDPPIGTCEEQAFIYIAKLHLSELLWWFDRKEEARILYREAGELKKRFNELFWMDDQGFLAMAVAGDRLIRTISSNPGHCIAAGIVEQSLVSRAAERLLAPDLFSGWGVRTLSSENPAYNPFSYHRGSVWPAEQGTFALGFVRYGLHEHAERICRAQFEAASLFEFNRLPEVFSGHPRDREHPFPAVYPRANSPQAWSASAVFTMLQSMLGLYPYAPLQLLLVDPHLPGWLPEITLSNLRVGRATTSIRFFRSGDSSSYEVLEKSGPLHVVRQPSPWSLTATFAERLKDFLVSLLPGK